MAVGQFHSFPDVNTRPKHQLFEVQDKAVAYSLTYRTKPSVWIVSYYFINAARGFLGLPEGKFKTTVKTFFKSNPYLYNLKFKAKDKHESSYLHN